MPRAVNTTDNFEKTMRKFKKRVADSGILQELRDRETYVKPSVHRKIAKNAARRRWQRYLSSQKLPQRQY